MASFPDDCLPPEGFYGSRDALYTAINQWAKGRGYAFTTSKSIKRDGRQIVTYACDCFYSCGARFRRLLFSLVRHQLCFPIGTIEVTEQQNNDDLPWARGAVYSLAV